MIYRGTIDGLLTLLVCQRSLKTRYAQPPTGNLRFKLPQPYIAEEGIYDVSEMFKVMCPQFDDLEGIPKGQEDCLFLNVYIPDTAFNNNKKLPVMVYLHGGALYAGSNNFNEYGPQHFMERDVIMVTVNYRLGPLGYTIHVCIIL